MTSAGDLLALQEIDLTRDARRALIADIEYRLGETEDLIAARDQVQTAEVTLEALQRRQRELDAQIEDLDAKIRPLETRLYDGSVRNPKELTDLQRDVESLKARRGRLDDEALNNMDAIETGQGALAEARRTLAAVEAAWRSDQEELREEKSRAERESASLEDERRRRTAGMDAGSLGAYETLRAHKQGRAVARIERGGCQGCRISLPTHIVQRVRAGEALVNCPSCERILVSA